MQYRHEIPAIITATAVVGGPLVVLGDVLERRAQSGSGLSPAEVRAAVRLIAAARHQMPSGEGQETQSAPEPAVAAGGPFRMRVVPAVGV